MVFSSSACYQSANTDINIVIQISKIIICTNILADFPYILTDNFGMPNKMISTEGKAKVPSWPGNLWYCCCGLVSPDNIA